MNETSLARLARFWWLVSLRGVLAIVFGIMALVWPGITLVVLILFFGAYMFVDGVVALAGAIRFRHDRERWVGLLLEGVIGIAIGAVTFFLPGITALAWLFTIAGWAILTGILEVFVALRLKGAVGAEILLALSGIVSVLFGIVMAVVPAVGFLAWVFIVATYAIVFGVLLLVAGFRLRGFPKASLSGPRVSARSIGEA
jgi:uncharacterized membrane protein HdeD (DUF308 family)